MNQLTAATDYRIIAQEVLAQLLPLLPEGTPTPKCVVTQFAGRHSPVHVQVLSEDLKVRIITPIAWRVFGGAVGIWDDRLLLEYLLAARRLHRKWRKYPQPKVEVPLLGSGVQS